MLRRPASGSEACALDWQRFTEPRCLCGAGVVQRKARGATVRCLPDVDAARRMVAQPRSQAYLESPLAVPLWQLVGPLRYRFC